MLELNRITKRYRKNKYDSIHDLSYRFPETGFVVLTGPSGAGKSTLLDIISGAKRNLAVLWSSMGFESKRAISKFIERNLCP